MTFMVWNEELETGIAIVDRQHRGLVDMLNQAAPVLAQSSQRNMSSVGPLLDELLDYAASHFRTEEEMMARLGMDARARDHHQASHVHFTAQVRDMVRAFTQGQGVTGDRLLSFLASWLILHILGEDQAMARQFRALENGMPPAQAYETERGDELHPAPAALSHALVGIYTVLTQQNRELLLTNQELDASRAEILHHNENLEHLVDLRTTELRHLAEDLRIARDSAEMGSRAKTRFLGTMSHELRTPMNAILGFSRLLHDQGLPPQQAILARKIISASDHLLELLNNIIDYARMEGSSEQAAEPVSFELAHMLAEASAEGFATARDKGLATALDVDPAIPASLYGNARCIQRILKVYLDNAVKFTERGEIRLTVTALETRADARLHLRFTVGDTGIGVSREAQARLFQPFTQADDKPDRKFEGIGLGLALVRELARLLNGATGVESEPGKGSRFWLDLDLPAGKRGAAATRHTAADAPQPRPTHSDAAAIGPMPENLYMLLPMLGKLLRAYDTRAGVLLEQAAPRLRPYLGAHLETLADLIAAFDYERALAVLQSIQSDVQAEKSHG